MGQNSFTIKLKERGWSPAFFMPQQGEGSRLFIKGTGTALYELAYTFDPEHSVRNRRRDCQWEKFPTLVGHGDVVPFAGLSPVAVRLRIIENMLPYQNVQTETPELSIEIHNYNSRI